MFKLIKDKVQKRIAKRALMTIKIDVIYSDGISTFKYKNLSVVQENGVSHLCYDSELAFCDLLTGERICPDEDSDIKYLSAIMVIEQRYIDRGRIRLPVEHITDLLNNYDSTREKERSKIRR